MSKLYKLRSWGVVWRYVDWGHIEGINSLLFRYDSSDVAEKVSPLFRQLIVRIHLDQYWSNMTYYIKKFCSWSVNMLAYNKKFNENIVSNTGMVTHQRPSFTLNICRVLFTLINLQFVALKYVLEFNGD